MAAFVVVGNEAQRQKRIAKYIREHAIVSYNIVRFEGKLKIADAKEIKRIVSIKQPANEKKLILASSEMTPEAQNSLLKTLEELPDGVEIIISARKKEDLLGTVLSRAFVMQPDVVLPERPEHAKLDNVLRQYAEGKDSVSASLLISDALTGSGTAGQIETLLYSLRKLLLEQIERDGKHSAAGGNVAVLAQVIGRCLRLYPFISRNNLNKRFSIDMIFLLK